MKKAIFVSLAFSMFIVANAMQKDQDNKMMIKSLTKEEESPKNQLIAKNKRTREFYQALASEKADIPTPWLQNENPGLQNENPDLFKFRSFCCNTLFITVADKKSHEDKYQKQKIDEYHAQKKDEADAIIALLNLDKKDT